MGKKHRVGKVAATRRRMLVYALIVLAAAMPAVAAPPSRPHGSYSSLTEGNASDAARRDAIRSIPLNKLSPDGEVKVRDVLANVSLFRRLPMRVIDCDPDMYLFLVRHPDVVVNIWEAFKISRIELRQLDENRFRILEPAGTVATFEYLYRSHDTHVLYGEGVYEGPLLGRPIRGRGFLVLKTGYVRETNDRYYITSRMDCFLNVGSVGADLVTKTISPLVGKTVDNNFVQTMAFVSSLSRTAEMNDRGVRRLASQLSHVDPEVRERFGDIAATLAQRREAADAARAIRTAEVASRATEATER